jgi:GTPase SAR1 family protein
MDSMFGPSESSALPMAFKAKVILLGDHAVGKSAVVNRYIKNYFEESKHVQ